MKTPTKITATALAATIAVSSMAAPVSAGYICAPKVPPSVGSSGGVSNPWPVYCVMGSAFGLIMAALAKKKGELTTQEAQAIAFSCGLRYWQIVANFR